MNHTRPSDAASGSQNLRETEKEFRNVEGAAGATGDGRAAGAEEQETGAGAQPAEAEMAAEPGGTDGAGSADGAGGEPDGFREDETGEQPAAESDAETFRRQAEKYRLEAEETHQRLLRLQADYDNFRRRTRQEKEEFVKYASLNLVERLLPVVDNFERALAAAQSAADFDSFVKGVNMIYRQLADVLAQEGLEPIKATGEPFNPEFHQAVMQVETEEYDDNIVVEELQKGYKLKEKVIRPSMVKVNARS